MLAVAEAYPQLRAGESFLALQQRLADVENHLQMARRYYNGTVRDYNTAVESFPSNLVARAFGFGVEEFFQVESALERAVPRGAYVRRWSGGWRWSSGRWRTARWCAQRRRSTGRELRAGGRGGCGVGGRCWIRPPSSAITDYRSDIAVDRDGWLTVTETIAVVADGDADQARHLPRLPHQLSRRRSARASRCRSTIVRVERDGHAGAVPHRVASTTACASTSARRTSRSRPGRTPTGSPIAPAQQLGFFADHDELYWNVTGNGWSFPIDRATANVVLPADVPRDRVTLEGYTGWQGSTEHALTTAVDRAQRRAAVRHHPPARRLRRA